MRSIRSRLAAAAGASAAGVAVLLISQRAPGSAVAGAIAVMIALSSGPAMALSVADPAAERARRALVRGSRFAPTLALGVIAATHRAGATSFSNIAGVNGAAGIPLVHGPGATVVGMWICLSALVLAVAGSTAAKLGSEAGIADRLSLAGSVVGIGLITALFVGPQIRSSKDAIPWIVGGLVLAAAVWFGRRLARRGIVPWASMIWAAIGLGLVLLGGRP